MKWNRVSRTSPLRPVLDPYVDWTHGPGRADYAGRSGNRKSLRLFKLSLQPTSQTGGGEDQTQGNIAGGGLPYLTVVASEDGGDEDFGLGPQWPELRLARLTLGLPAPAACFAPTTARRRRARPPIVPSNPPVVVGVIDDGLPLAHQRFTKAAGTRIERAWIQNAQFDASGKPMGRVIARQDIDDWVNRSTFAGVFDEDSFYRLSGLGGFQNPQRKTVMARSSHGAHVMDVAFGFPPEDAPDWPIVAVQLPFAATADTSGATLTPYAVEGVKFIVESAKAMSTGAPPPVVVNFSYGFTAGPHDGTHDLELALDEIARSYGGVLRIVLPSGNAHLARAHAAVRFPAVHPAPGSEQALTLRVSPDDRTPSFVELWLPPAAAGETARVSVALGTPGGLASSFLAEGETELLQLDDGGQILAQVSYVLMPPPTNRGMFLIALQPTARLEADGALVPVDPVASAGRWTIRLLNHALSPQCMVKAWVQRDDTPYGYPPRGRQAYFEGARGKEDDYVRFDTLGRENEVDFGPSPILRAGSINAIATGKDTVVIGALTRREMRASRYSAGGPTTAAAGQVLPNRAGPDIVALADESVVHAGVLAAGTRSNSVAALNGTSVAAPLVARAIAEELAAGGLADVSFVENLATPIGGGRERVGAGGYAVNRSSAPRDRRVED